MIKVLIFAAAMYICNHLIHGRMERLHLPLRCKMKDNCEGDESSPSLPISEPKINLDEGDIANDYKGYFGSD